MSDTDVFYYHYRGLGGMLERERLSRKLSRAKLAELAGVNPNSLAKWEKAGLEDGKYPPLPKLTRLCKILDIDPRDVFEVVYRESEKQAPTDIDPETGIAFEDPDAFSFKRHFQEKGAERDYGYLHGKLGLIEHYLEQLFEKVEKVDTRLGVVTDHKENGPDRDDPGRPSQNPSAAVSAASDQPKEEDQT
ncbi:MAG: helix-turn-helix transcriptional regulator [Alphaproteobacteria bacterium]|nr:helix-turn-helix transcriptional regulator [Alphaproteobacteria bacterium]